MDRCEVCGRRCNTLYNIELFGNDDIYAFDVCKNCADYYSSDIFRAEDIFEDIKRRKGDCHEKCKKEK